MNQTAHKTAPQSHTNPAWFTPSNSNGKEKDYESGFHYYGARYYWSETLTGWLSVDPMMDKYPGISPYNYCILNPVKLVDPNGMDTVFAGERERALYLQYRSIVFSDDRYKYIQEELLHLEQAPEVFCIRIGDNITNNSGGGNFTYNVETNQFDINIKENKVWSDIERLSHELKHADQFLNRKLTMIISRNGEVRFLNYSIDDEQEAYYRQGIFGNTLTTQEVYKRYSEKGLFFYRENNQYTPTIEEIRCNIEFLSNLGHPCYLYQGWENDVKKNRIN